MVNAKKSILIGLAGGAGSGKTTIAQAFQHEQDFKILSFAKPLKDALIAMTGLESKWFYDIEFKEKGIPGLTGITPRMLMQLFGTEFAREMIYHDFWLWRMRHSISEYSDRNIVIDDVRFENEAKLIRDNGGIIIHLNRPYEKPTKHTKHKSEHSLVQYSVDFSIKGINSIETYRYARNAQEAYYGV